MYVCMYGCVGSSFLCEGFLYLWQAGATLHRGARASHYRSLLLPSTGSRCAGSVIVAHGPSCSASCGIFPDQGSNPRPLHWQADSQPLRHQGSPPLTSLYFPNLTLFLQSTYPMKLSFMQVWVNICLPPADHQPLGPGASVWLVGPCGPRV